ncbi:porin family protein [Cesiribacter andamanensis]|uniref:Outer membrane protein beta-barrel domain-containing protein n=1 Tax=Cesiribacter andamanensis AMV16 TaxID=1279009 RepID=M7N6U3_9BACT|nr:porin family protein [Cesiribacter andamanensis]EMR04313.1 hypothetical protein ADICEAN_00476 [Cesiribacter andamanensis AMV16]
MKKACLVLLGLALAIGAQAQSKIGIKFSPTLSTNRVNYEGSDFSVNSDGIGGRFVFGVVYDLFLADNYSFSTGLMYAPKRVGLEVTDRTTSMTRTEAYSLQYLQLPASLKLFTNELALDTRMYFQLGGLLDVKINEKAQSDDNRYIDKFQFFDFSVHLGAGAEYRLGYNTVLFGGFFYNRGVVNAARRTNDFADKLRINNDLLGLDLGIKF